MVAPIWDLFAEVPETNKAKVKCRHCGIVLTRGKPGQKTGLPTTSMNQHGTTFHADKLEIAREKRRKAEESVTLNVSSSSSASSSSSSAFFTATPSARKARAREDGQASILNFVDAKRGPPWGLNHPQSKRVHKALLNMVVMDNQPFSMVDDAGFIAYSAALESR